MLDAIGAIEHAKSEVEQVAREIYYAMSHLPNEHPSRKNLRNALRSLGIIQPSDVGLRNDILTRQD